MSRELADFFTSLSGTLMGKDKERKDLALADNYQRRKQQVDYLGNLLRDPRLKEDARQGIVQSLAELTMHPHDEKGNQSAALAWANVSSSLLGKGIFQSQDEMDERKFQQDLRHTSLLEELRGNLEDLRARTRWDKGDVIQREGADGKKAYVRLQTNALGESRETALDGTPLAEVLKQIQTTQRASTLDSRLTDDVQKMAYRIALEHGIEWDRLDDGGKNKLMQAAAQRLKSNDDLRLQNTQNTITNRNAAASRGDEGLEITKTNQKRQEMKDEMTSLGAEYSEYKDEKNIRLHLADQAQKFKQENGKNPTAAELKQWRQDYLNAFPKKGRMDMLRNALEGFNPGIKPVPAPPVKRTVDIQGADRQLEKARKDVGLAEQTLLNLLQKKPLGTTR